MVGLFSRNRALMDGPDGVDVALTPEAAEELQFVEAAA